MLPSPKRSSVGDDRNLPPRPQSQLSWPAREFNRVGSRVSSGGWRPDRKSSAHTLAGTHPIGRAAAGRSLWRRIRELQRTNLAAAATHLLIEAIHIWVLRAGLMTTDVRSCPRESFLCSPALSLASHDLAAIEQFQPLRSSLRKS